MTIFQAAGKLDSAETALSGTGATPVLSGGDNGVWVDSVRLANTTASPVNCTVDKYNGSAAFDLVTLHPLPARSGISAADPTSVLKINEPFYLKANWTLRVTGNTGVVVTVNYVKAPGRT